MAPRAPSGSPAAKTWPTRQNLADIIRKIEHKAAPVSIDTKQGSPATCGLPTAARRKRQRRSASSAARTAAAACPSAAASLHRSTIWLRNAPLSKDG